jgi:RNA polymerase sigma-70 factor, ECF subfamily
VLPELETMGDVGHLLAGDAHLARLDQALGLRPRQVEAGAQEGGHGLVRVPVADDKRLGSHPEIVRRLGCYNRFVDSDGHGVEQIVSGPQMGDDADLIRRWQQGDAEAFGVVVRRWQRPVGRFLARLVGPGAGVADLTQEVFLRAHRAIGRYRESGTFSTWLYRIALNLARDAGRKARRAPAPLPAEVAAGPASEPWEKRELADAVSVALAELPAPLREVLVLRHYEDMRFEEMARLFGVPASTLKSRFAVALRRMRERLTELGYGEDGSSP